VFLLSSVWTFVALIGVLVIVVGDMTPVSLLVGLLMFVPSVVVLARPARVADGVLITRRPYLMTRRVVRVDEITSVELGLMPAEWGGPWGFHGVRLILKDGSKVPVPESACWSRSHAGRWADALTALTIRCRR
jgi:hypothetical protein